MHAENGDEMPKVVTGPTPPTYVESPAQYAQREKSFVYHSPKGDQPGRYSLLRCMANDLAEHFNKNCPPSRELSLAMTNLEQAVFWANASIARNE